MTYYTPKKIADLASGTSNFLTKASDTLSNPPFSGRKWNTLCEYGNHTVDMHPQTLFVYTDTKNGIKRDTQTCPQCYVDHLRKYYPDSPIIPHMLEQYPELT